MQSRYPIDILLILILERFNGNHLIFTYLFTYLLTSWCRTLFEKLTVTQLAKKYPAFFMELEGSLPFSQKPATGHYPKPAESSSPHRSLSP
jgi:hypothetical protein